MSGDDNDLPFGGDEPGPPAALLTCRPDGSHGFSELKKLAQSGKQYLHACNHRSRPTASMLLGTAVHARVLGMRLDRPLAVFPGATRRGKGWDLFEAANPRAEIVTASEWALAGRIADSVFRDPLAMEQLEGARYEVPLAWDEDGIPCSTSGVDIIGRGRLGDLKTCRTANPDQITRQAETMLYHAQLAFYARGARAHGIDISRGLFLICVETAAPFEVVVLEPDAAMLEEGDRAIAKWLSLLRVYRESNQWPGYAQSPVVWSPRWRPDAEDEDEGDEAAQ